MFRCENKGCHKVVERHQPVNRIVVETRPKTYVNYIKKGYNDTIKVETEGEEIAREIDVCPECFFNITGLQPARSTAPVAQPVKRKRRGMSDEQKPWRNQKRHGKKPKEESGRKKPIVEKVERLKGQKNERT